jgi:hypothetical protein
MTRQTSASWARNGTNSIQPTYGWCTCLSTYRGSISSLLLDHPTQWPGPLHHLDAVADHLLDLPRLLATTATPFDWKFTRTEFNALLARIDTHQPLTAAA